MILRSLVIVATPYFYSLCSVKCVTWHMIYNTDVTWHMIYNFDNMYLYTCTVTHVCAHAASPRAAEISSERLCSSATRPNCAHYSEKWGTCELWQRCVKFHASSVGGVRDGSSWWDGFVYPLFWKMRHLWTLAKVCEVWCVVFGRSSWRQFVMRWLCVPTILRHEDFRNSGNDTKIHDALREIFVVKNLCRLQWVAVSCSELQWVAVSCSALQWVAVSYSELQWVAEHCSELQSVAVSCSLLQSVAVWCSELQWYQGYHVTWNPRHSMTPQIQRPRTPTLTEIQKKNVRPLQCVAVCCSALQHVAVCCSALQHVAVCYSVSQCFAVCCSVSPCVVAVCCCSVAGYWNPAGLPLARERPSQDANSAGVQKNPT